MLLWGPWPWSFLRSHLLGLSTIPLFAFAGSLATVLLVFNLARTAQRTPVINLILAGVAVSSVLSAVVSLLMFLMPQEGLHGLVFWLMGGFSGRSWNHVVAIAPHCAVGLVVVVAHARQLNAFLLGEEEAMSLGVDVQKTTRRLVAAASLLTAASVAAGGIIAFAGLVVPHLVRADRGSRSPTPYPQRLSVGGGLHASCRYLGSLCDSAQGVAGGHHHFAYGRSVFHPLASQTQAQGMVMGGVHVHGGNVYSAARQHGVPLDQLVDFSANINPLGPSPQALEAIKDNLDLIRHYPDLDSTELTEELARYLHVEPDLIVVGNGAAEIIQLVAEMVAPRRGLVFSPTFAEYAVAIERVGGQVIRVPYDVAEEHVADADMLFYAIPITPRVN